jgi:hypothetical protein
LFNIALIAVASVLLGWRQDAPRRAILAATVGIAGLLQLSILVPRGGNIAKPLRIPFDKEMRGFSGRAIPGMIASSAAMADGGRRRHRIHLALGGVLALLRQPPAGTAARHRRRRQGTVLS